MFVIPLCASVNLCLVITCWESADLLAIVCGVYHFPIGILSQVCYLHPYLHSWASLSADSNRHEEWSRIDLNVDRDVKNQAKQTKGLL